MPAHTRILEPEPGGLSDSKISSNKWNIVERRLLDQRSTSAIGKGSIVGSVKRKVVQINLHLCKAIKYTYESYGTESCRSVEV